MPGFLSLVSIRRSWRRRASRKPPSRRKTWPAAEGVVTLSRASTGKTLSIGRSSRGAGAVGGAATTLAAFAAAAASAAEAGLAAAGFFAPTFFAVGLAVVFG